MRGCRRRALAVLALLTLGAVPCVQACEVVLTGHRSGRALARLPLDPANPVMEIAFTHSVLGTPVRDRYAWRAGPDGPHAELVEERFEGEGYGLPHAAGPGETLAREGAGWRLQLLRRVDPLVVRPLPSQRMRVLVPGQPELLLGALGTESIHFQAQGCTAPSSPGKP